MQISKVPIVVVSTLFILGTFCRAGADKISDEKQVNHFLHEVNERGTQLCTVHKLSVWAFHNDLNSQIAKENATKAGLAYWKFWKEISDDIEKYDVSSATDERTKRLFRIMSIYGQSVTNDKQMKKFTEAKQAMESIYSKAKVCSYNNSDKCNLALEPDLTLAMKNTDKDQVDTLKYYWLAFRDATGKKMRLHYKEMANIIYETVATGQNYESVMAAETRFYETPNMESVLATLWKQLEPFYKELHAYVRYRLHEHYGPEHISLTGPLPAHLLGNMWAQSWSGVFDIVVPFPDKQNIDITPKLIELQLKPVDMVKIAEEFFQSLGFRELPSEFWNGSVLEKPADGREIICHASAWDMCDGYNFWIKQCTRPTIEDFLTLHHEMGHIYYQIMYKDEPILFRDGANPGFHEAIGDLISLSVQTPKHLQTVGLLDEIDENDEEANINYLLSLALDSIAFLPFGYLVDQWRWNVFQKIISPDSYNYEWWKLRVGIQGVAPPELRSEDDFDPGAKFHIASNTGYTRYFVSSIIQFQFHEALCKIAGKYDPVTKDPPLHKCDIYGSKQAGSRLIRMLKLGYSRPWQDAMEIVTGAREMNAGSILEYFHPLIKWLEKENQRLNLTVGWKPEKEYCVGGIAGKHSDGSGMGTGMGRSDGSRSQSKSSSGLAVSIALLILSSLYMFD